MVSRNWILSELHIWTLRSRTYFATIPSQFYIINQGSIPNTAYVF